MPSCVIPRETVMPVFGTSANLIRVVRVRPDRLGEVLADLARDDVEGGRELDVADVVAAEVDVHEPGDELVLGRRPCSTRRPGASEFAQLPTPMIATRTLSSRARACRFGCRSLDAIASFPPKESEPVAEASSTISSLRGATAVVSRARASALLELASACAGQHARARSRAGCPSAARLEGDAEARGEDPDGDVVEARAPRARPRRRARRLSVGRHPHEHVCELSRHAQKC